MTVYIEKPALSLRSELASLRNQGGYQEQQFYFDSLVTNGTFDSNISGWTPAGANTSLSWVAGRIKVEKAVASSYPAANQTLTGLTVGKAYLLSGDIFGNSGSLRGWISFSGFGGGSIVSTPGRASVNLVATATSHVFQVGIYSGDGTVGQFVEWDNISLFETDGTDVIHTMPQGWKPKDFFEDGLLQREGAANDYEVVYDGFDYVIKPTVAPSATTQTCVIGVKA